MRLSDLESKRTACWSYLASFVVLLLIVSQFQIFWRSNDDVALSFIADGGGQVLTPGPHLVLTNIAWGYLVYGLHLLGDPWAYASSIYLGLALSYLALVYVFFHSKLNHPLAALVLLCVYLPTVLSPQHTLVAGYLGFAGIALLCNSIERRHLAGGYAACLLLVLSSLVRWDETAFVLLVALPLCWKYVAMAWGSEQRRRWIVLGAAACVVGLGFLLVDYLSFGSGEWAEYAATYPYQMLFTDFGIARYFYAHSDALQGTGFSINDLHLFSNWFYCDTQVFVPERLAVLLDHISWPDRIGANLSFYREAFRPLTDPEVMAFLITLLPFFAAHRRRWHLLASLGVLALLLVVLTVLGRPEVTRVYLPALGALLVLGVLELEVRTWLMACLLAAAILVVDGRYLQYLHGRNLYMQARSTVVRKATCALPQDSLIITWGADYPYIYNYLPFGSKTGTCYLNNYAFGEYSLAPFALEHLHRYTGGKDFVPAVLGGQAFEILANRNAMRRLQAYFRSHYHADLQFSRDPLARGFPLFHLQLAAAPASGP